MILFLHNRYRTTGGEERVVEELLGLVRERLGEPAELLGRDSASLSRTRAAWGLLRGGVAPQEVARAVRLTQARVVHAHNLNPGFGWRALQAARGSGARVVLHLHQYRLVCANGVCFTGGEDCTRCHGSNTLPGVLHRCRGPSRAEGLAYGAALALWQRSLTRLADVVVVPSVFARERLRELGAPLDFERVHVLPPPLLTPERAPEQDGEYALLVSRLAVEKGIDVAIDACAQARVPLLIAGDGPQRDFLQARARTQGGEVRFLGHVPSERLPALHAGAALALVPSRAAETFGVAAAEAMMAGVPVVASRVGALPELVEADGLVSPGDPAALAQAIARRWDDRQAGERGRERVHELCDPQAVGEGLRHIYAAACA